MCQNRLPTFGVRFQAHTRDSSLFRTLCRIELDKSTVCRRKKLRYWRRLQSVHSSAVVISKLPSALIGEERVEATPSLSLGNPPLICSKIIVLKWLSGKVCILPRIFFLFTVPRTLLIVAESAFRINRFHVMQTGARGVSWINCFTTNKCQSLTAFVFAERH